MVLYLLGAENGVTSIAKGVDNLKGVDAQRVRNFLAAAEAEGILVGDAMLEMHRLGHADDVLGGGADDWILGADDGEPPKMLNVHKETIELQCISAISTEFKKLSGFWKIKVDNPKCIIPKATFDTMEPMDSGYDLKFGCMDTVSFTFLP